MRFFKSWVYYAGWTIFGLAALAAPIAADTRYTITVFAWFLILESFAVIDTDSGDTLSEQVWSFYGGKPARLHLVFGWTVYLVCAFLSVVLGTWPLYVGWVALGLGLGLWLLDHFANMGRNG